MDQRLLVKLDELKQFYYELNDLLPNTPDEYLASRVIQRASERLIQISIECILDICSILVKELQLGVPHRDDDIFVKLKNVVFDDETIETLRKMKRFRNRIVHRYGDLNYEQIYSLISILLSDILDFIQKIQDFLSRDHGPHLT